MHNGREVGRWTLAAGAMGLAAALIAWIEVDTGYARFAAAALGLGCAWSAWRVGKAHEELRLRLGQGDERASLQEARSAARRDVIESMADRLALPLFVCDAKGAIVLANRAAVQLFDYPRPEGSSLLSVTLSNEFQDLVRRAQEGGGIVREEIVVRYPEERIGDARAWPDPGCEGWTYATMQDVTSLRRLERTRRDFVSNVSHELRTPLATIRAMAETLLEAEEDERRALGSRYLGKIIGETDRLTLITDDLLTLGIAESEPVAKTRTDLAALVRAAVEFERERAEAKGVAVAFDASEAVFCDVNPHQMSQVVRNLLDNALNHTERGRIDVSLSCTEGGVELKVADTGVGIASEHHQRIFERFYRIDKGRSRATGGTGLGLSIVRHIVEAHGGTVSVASTVGSGTTFTVALPGGTEATPRPGSGLP